MREILEDIIAHTVPLKMTELTITGDEEETIVESLDAGRESIIIKGFLKEPIPDLKGVSAVGNLPTLKGLIGFENFKKDGASIDVNRELRPNLITGEETETVVSLSFVDSQGQEFTHRFKSAEDVETKEHLEFVGCDWQHEMRLSKEKLNEIRYMANLYNNANELVEVSTDDQKRLLFRFGSVDGGTIIVDTDVGVRFNKPIYYPAQMMLSVLALDNNCLISFFNDGYPVMQFSTETDYVKWYYIFLRLDV